MACYVNNQTSTKLRRPFRTSYGFPCCRGPPASLAKAMTEANQWPRRFTRQWLSKVAKRTIVFVGDRMSRQWAEALLCQIERDAQMLPERILSSDDVELRAEYANGLRVVRISCLAIV